MSHARVWTLLPALLMAGCASLPLEMGGFGGSTAPQTVAGLTYEEIQQLGALRGTCAHLQDMRRQGRRVDATEMTERLLPACEQMIESAREKARQEREEAERREIAVFMAREWAVVEAQVAQRRSREREWREAEQQRQEAELLRAQLAQAEEKQAERRAALAERIRTTTIYDKLSEYEDKPVAHSIGQPSQTTLKTFLACVELAYPNKGYRISQSGRTLTIIAREAQLPRGDLPIEMRFNENPQYWRMTYLMVADIEARQDADRFVLSQNLVAQSCPQEGGLF
ncbi:hypothetical protein K8B33_04990 [Alcanivorax sp. JB21]|uniref:hypothetical protein n=1 Tax=Alcanivorax limicola TaxID=2874102 RepID=UPI001CBDDEA2|nr:hypothetical protein [Alcanivorax limicola]MBZ2188439.1 hypothetical protein [Alcanivorax limicola]